MPLFNWNRASVTQVASGVALLGSVAGALIAVDVRYAKADVVSKFSAELNEMVQLSDRQTRDQLMDYRIDYLSDRVDDMMMRSDNRALRPVEAKRLDQIEHELNGLIDMKNQRNLMMLGPVRLGAPE